MTVSSKRALRGGLRRFGLGVASGAACRLEGLAANIRLRLLARQLAPGGGVREGELFSRREIFENQIGVSARTLERIVRKAARPGMLALEIGSWAGASTGIIGKVVKENLGLLCCVDSWKGGTGLHDGEVDLLAVSKRVDICGVFTENIRKLGLENTVLPLKMSSRDAARILKDECFDFIFIDAEHTYDGVRADIDAYLPKVKVGGMLSGHDCEGKLDDFDREYIDMHKDIDFDRVRGLHCGVIKAVGERFAQYEVEDCVWFLAKHEQKMRHSGVV